MPFDTGPVSFCFCLLPQVGFTRNPLPAFADFSAGPLESIEKAPQVGWVSGRHMLETRIDEETAIMGGYLHLCLRTAERKIPPSLLQAECKMEEMTFMQENNLSVCSKKERKRIREEVTDRLISKMPPTLTGIPFVLDETSEILYVGTTSPKQLEDFMYFLSEALGFDAEQLTPRRLAEWRCNQAIDILPPLTFSPEPVPDATIPDTGRDFATWLWYFLDREGGKFQVDPYGEFTVMLDGPLTFAWEEASAMEAVIRKGSPLRSAEAKAALSVGKKLRLVKVTLAYEKLTWVFTLDADHFGFRGMVLPTGDELDPASHFQERVISINLFRDAFFRLYEIFIERLTGPGLKEMQADIHRWSAELE